jgi:uncharacterized protein YdaU (DUF1376 family)
MNDPRPGFLFNVVEFWSSEKVDAMDDAAIGVYVFLLSRQWQNGSVPGDAAELERMCRRILSRPWAQTWPMVEACFPLDDDGRRRNVRLERCRMEADERSGQASAAVKERWRRWREDQERKRREREGTATDATAKADSHTDVQRSNNDRSATDLPGEGRDSEREGSSNPQPPEASLPPVGRPAGRRADPEPAPEAKSDPPPAAEKPKRTRAKSAAEKAWDAAWEPAKGEPFVWPRSQGQAIADLSGRPGVTVEEITRRAKALLASSRDFHRQRQNPRGLLECWADFQPPRVAPAPKPAPPLDRATDFIRPPVTQARFAQ